MFKRVNNSAQTSYKMHLFGSINFLIVKGHYNTNILKKMPPENAQTDWKC